MRVEEGPAGATAALPFWEDTDAPPRSWGGLPIMAGRFAGPDFAGRAIKRVPERRQMTYCLSGGKPLKATAE